GTFNKQTKQFHFPENETKPGNIHELNANRLLFDRDDRLWIGFEDRLEVVDPFRQIFQHFSFPEELVEDPSFMFICNFNELEEHIVVTGRGTNSVLYFDRALSTYSQKQIMAPNGFLVNNNWEVYAVNDQEWLFAQRNLPTVGLMQFNPSDPRPTIPAQFVPPTSETQGRVFRRMLQDNDGGLWVLQDDILRFDLDQDTFVRYPNSLKAELGDQYRFISSIFIDSKDQLWAGSEIGPRVFHRKDLTPIDIPSWTDVPIDGNEIRQFAEDRSGKIWIATAQRGLQVYDPTTQSYRSLRMRDGLPSDQTYNILVDRNGAIWVSTGGGLSRINTQTFEITSFTTQDGLKRNDLGYLWCNSMQQISTGEIFIGDFAGFTWFHPDRIPENEHPPTIVFTGFKVFDRPYQFGQNLNYLDRIKLTHDQNFFQFEFAALDFTNPDKNRYRYKLEGYDTEWRSAVVGQASYTGIRGGHYTFRVRAANSHGVWNDQGIAIKVFVAPPFWQTWWFLALCIISGLGLLALIYWSRIQTIK
ncbi:MAG: two-component regulator propeller domain-containing protein, partial [Bacteroidota bacterium]